MQSHARAGLRPNDRARPSVPAYRSRSRPCRTGTDLGLFPLLSLPLPFAIPVSIVIAGSGSDEDFSCARNDGRIVARMSGAISGVGIAFIPGFRFASSGLRLRQLQLIMRRVIGIADFLAAIEGRSVVGRQRKSVLETARQVGIGDEDASECDGVGVARGNRRFGRLARKTAG